MILNRAARYPAAALFLLVNSFGKAIEVLISTKVHVASPVVSPVEPSVARQTADSGKIVLGGGVRLPVKTADSGKIVLGGGVRLPLKTA